MSVPPELLGPLGLTVGAIVAVIALAKAISVLWNDHLKADAGDRAQRDAALALLHDAVQANAAHAEANRAMAAAWESRTRQDAARARRSDRP
jgi:hypothetical protein